MQTQISIRQRKHPILSLKTKIQGIKTVGFCNILGRKTGAQTEGKKTKTVKIFKTLQGLKLGRKVTQAKAAARKAAQTVKAFALSLKAITLERAIQAKKALLKYGYSFAKTVEVARAYLALRNFKLSLGYSLKSLIFG